MNRKKVETDRGYYRRIYSEESEAPWSSVSELDRRTLDWLNRYRSEIPRPRRMIDLGAGEGRITNLFAGESFEAVGIDVLGEPLKRAATLNRSGNAHFLRANAFKPPLGQNIFSVAVDYGLLHHVRKADWSRYRRALGYLLTPGAFCFISVFHQTDNHANRTTRKWVYHRGHYDRFFEEDDLIECLGTDYSLRESGTVTDGKHVFLHALFQYRPAGHD